LNEEFLDLSILFENNPEEIFDVFEIPEDIAFGFQQIFGNLHSQRDAALALPLEEIVSAAESFTNLF
jgi:hypothetical protein